MVVTTFERYNDGKGDKPKYVGTFGEDNSQNNKQLRTLQSCLRITYTSPKTMHWISLILTSLLENESCDIIEILEDYAKQKFSNQSLRILVVGLKESYLLTLIIFICRMVILTWSRKLFLHYMMSGSSNLEVPLNTFNPKIPLKVKAGKQMTLMALATSH